MLSAMNRQDYPHHPLADVSAEQFLRDYWQKRPLLIRQAYPGFESPLSPDELAGLACEAEVESRLLLEKGGSKPWELRYGPFNDADFAALPADHWTLLVQEVNKYVPEAARLLDDFGFIPGWRLDDLMVSYAEDQGSVGPHIDRYDVFLLQAWGERRWQISTTPVAADNRLPDIELDIMREFSAEQEWVLQPGDLLYLPPEVAHYGIAEGPCMTFSVGFRAPALRGLVEDFSDQALEGLAPEALYRDPDLGLQPDTGAISAQALAKIRALIRGALSRDDEAMDAWFARRMSLPQRGEPSPAREPELGEAAWLARLAGGAALWRSDYSRFAFLDHGQDGVSLYVDGRDYHLSAATRDAVAWLTSHRELAGAALAAGLEQPEFRVLLLRLYNRRALYLSDDDD